MARADNRLNSRRSSAKFNDETSVDVQAYSYINTIEENNRCPDLSLPNQNYSQVSKKSDKSKSVNKCASHIEDAANADLL